MAELAAAIQRLLNSPLGAVLAVILAALFLGTFLWKIIRAEEGFLLGYGNLVFGKWQANRDPPVRHPALVSHPGPATSPASVHHHACPAPACQASDSPASRQTCERTLQVADDALRLSRMLDTDLAYTLASPGVDWAAQLGRHCQTLVAGIPKVIRPGCRCRCGFFIPDPQSGKLVLAVGEGFRSRPRLNMESCAGRAFLTGEDYYCKDTLTDPVYWPSASGSREFRSIACVPVRAGRTIFGVICLDAERPDAFTQEDFGHLETFAAKLALICAIDLLQAQMFFPTRPSPAGEDVG